jgi:glucan-binding YG repeat protein
MSDMMAGQTLYASQLEISEATENSGTQQSENLRYKQNLAENADMKTLKNADGFHSINPIEVKIQKELYRKKQEDAAKDAKDAKTPSKKEENEAKVAKEKAKTEKVKQANESLDKTFVRFKIGNEKHNLIYTDESLLKYYLVKTPAPDTVLVSGITVTITIDGISGLATADYFLIDGVPEVYNQNGCFQITSIQQGINADGWLTTITADWLRKQI